MLSSTNQMIPNFVFGAVLVSLTAATILADAAVTPLSPKWPEMCRVGH